MPWGHRAGCRSGRAYSVEATEESDLGYEQGSSRRLYLRSDPRRNIVDACLCGRDTCRAALAGGDVPEIDAAGLRQRQSRRKIGAPPTPVTADDCILRWAGSFSPRFKPV